MRTPVGRSLREEAARYVFRFACDDCVHVDLPGRAAGIGESERVSDPSACCSLGYPPTPRRSALLDVARGAPAEDGSEAYLELCKSFELG